MLCFNSFKGVRGIHNPASIQKAYTYDSENDNEPRQELCIIEMLSVLGHETYIDGVAPMKWQYMTS